MAEEAKTCRHCGAELMESGKFCPMCGKSTETEKMICPDCGFETEKKIKFCPMCGQACVSSDTMAKKKPAAKKASAPAKDYVHIEGLDHDYCIGKYTVTQKLYERVTGGNPSEFRGVRRPVERVSWYDAIRFCNMLSEQEGKTPVYAVDGSTDVDDWNYTPHEGNELTGEVTQDAYANGYRLPTNEEWEHAARGGENYIYAGSNDIDDVAWYRDNSGGETHDVGQKQPNGYGLYDMSGNVWEWCWDSNEDGVRCYRDGSCYDYADSCEVSIRYWYDPCGRINSLGFRLAFNI